MAGGIMWLGGDLVFLTVVILLVLAWMRDDERRTVGEDRRLGAERGGDPGAGGAAGGAAGGRGRRRGGPASGRGPGATVAAAWPGSGVGAGRGSLGGLPRSPSAPGHGTRAPARLRDAHRRASRRPWVP